MRGNEVEGSQEIDGMGYNSQNELRGSFWWGADVDKGGNHLWPGKGALVIECGKAIHTMDSVAWEELRSEALGWPYPPCSLRDSSEVETAAG